MNKFDIYRTRYAKLHLMCFVIKKTYDVLFYKLHSLYYQYAYNYGKNFSLSQGVNIAAPKLLSVGYNVSFEPGSKAYYEILGILEIGDNCRIGRYSVLDFSGGLILGNNVVISESVKCYTHSHGYCPNNPPKGIRKTIGDDVWIGSNAIITENCKKIGANSIIGAGSVVTKNVPSNCVYAGNPAKLIKHIPKVTERNT